MNIEERVKKEILDNYQTLYKLAYSYVLNADDAMDIVQESVYKAIIKCDTIKKEESVSSWIYRIVMNTAFETLRKKKKIHIHNQTDQVPFTDSIIEKTSIKAAMQRLEEKDRAVIALRYFEDMKISDIADVLDENINTVKSRLYRALNKLKIELTDDLK